MLFNRTLFEGNNEWFIVLKLSKLSVALFVEKYIWFLFTEQTILSSHFTTEWLKQNSIQFLLIQLRSNCGKIWIFLNILIKPDGLFNILHKFVRYQIDIINQDKQKNIMDFFDTTEKLRSNFCRWKHWRVLYTMFFLLLLFAKRNHLSDF